MNRVFQLTLDVLDPLVLTEGSSEGQGHESLDYIPGTALLGAMACQLGIAPATPLFRTLFLSEATRFLNGYPAIDQRRSLPIPRSLAQDKGGAGHVIDRLWFVQDRTGLTAAQGALGVEKPHLKAVLPGFLDEKTGAVIEVQKEIRLHVGIDPATRRAQEGVLFLYQSILPGQRFIAYVLSDDGEAADLLAAALCRTRFLRLGRSRSTGYGRIAVTVEEKTSGDWREADSSSTDGPEHVLTLLSDYCPRPGWTVWESFLEDLRPYFEPLTDGEVVTAYASTRIIRSFRGVWGLPRPPVTALTKGSVLRILAPRSQTLESLASDGIGARRNEGFGRVAVDWILHLHAQADPHRLPADFLKKGDVDRPILARRLSLSPTTDGNSDHERLRNLLRRRQIERVTDDLCARALASSKAKALIDDLAKPPGRRLLPNHQLSNLRNAVACTTNLREVSPWFQKVLEKTSGLKWEQVRIRSLTQSHRKHLGQLVLEELLGPDGLAAFDTITKLIPGAEDDLTILHTGPDIPPADEAAFKQTLCRKFVVGLLTRVLVARNSQQEART